MAWHAESGSRQAVEGPGSDEGGEGRRAKREEDRSKAGNARVYMTPNSLFASARLILGSSILIPIRFARLLGAALFPRFSALSKPPRNCPRLASRGKPPGVHFNSIVSSWAVSLCSPIGGVPISGYLLDVPG